MVKKDSDVELEELHIILLKNTLKSEQQETEKQFELHDLFKNLNPRFFEQAIPVKDTIQRLYTSDIIFRSTFDFSRMF